MVISQVIGGLGNQMFQYAAGRALALAHDTSLVLDTSGFKNYELHQGFELGRVFSAPFAEADAKDMTQVLGWRRHAVVRRLLDRLPRNVVGAGAYVNEPHFHHWPQFEALPAQSYLAGYWQSEKYFQRHALQIRKDFTFAPAKGRNAELAAEIYGVNAVSLHVRRGDYVSNPGTTAVHGLCSLAYYQDAIRVVIAQVPDARLYIFSDEIKWARQNLQITVPHKFIEHNQGKDSFNDMMLMSRCQHHIIANSSFSWWGAWLNGSSSKLVIAPEKWFADDKSTADLIPHQWMRL